MNAWTQPICEACFAAWLLGQGEEPRHAPAVVHGTPPDPCLVCGTDTRIYIRVDPRLTVGLAHARPNHPKQENGRSGD